MAFGQIMRFAAGELNCELAPLTRESMAGFVNLEHGGGMQQHSITRYMGTGLAPALEDEYEWYDRVRQDKTSLLWGIWIVENGNRTLIGTTGFNGIGSEGSTLIRQATTGSMIFRQDYWGRGIASQAHKTRTWYGFQHLGLHRIRSAAIQDNVASRKALENSGYQLVYTERNFKYVDGRLRHLDCLACLNPLEHFWRQWWHDDRPPSRARQARQTTRQVMDWAEDNVELP